MKKLLFVTCEYFPYVTANVNCMQTILDGFKEAGYEITVLTVSYEPQIAQYEKKDGVTVYRVPVTEYKKVDDALYGERSVLRKLPDAVKQALSYLGYKCVDQIKVRRTARQFFKKIDEPFDMMLSVVYLPQGHKIAYRIARRRRMKWVLYFLDPYAYSWPLRKSRILTRKTQERVWSRRASAVVTTVGIVEENRRHGFDPYGTLPQLELPLPNLTIQDAPPQPAEKAPGDKIVLRYTGVFYGDIRRPDELLAFLDKLDPERFTAEFYGKCCEFLRANFPRLPACVQLKNHVSVQECRALTESADILINVGNTCPNQVPSKVFEYIAAAKPILNFYSTENDSSLIYLKDYPCVLSLRSAADAGEEELLEMFGRGKKLTVQDVREQYAEYLSDNVVRKFVAFAEEV
ncbi:MAG: hypothetical protein IJT44_09070 [Clostridia bacterium]|nr:hypothetical protein [Clostridia bacterium]